MQGLEKERDKERERKESEREIQEQRQSTPVFSLPFCFLDFRWLCRVWLERQREKER